MQNYSNMEIKELATQLTSLDDNNFKLIIKDLESEQLSELISLVPMEKKLRIGQELTIRKSVASTNAVAENKTVPLELALTANNIIPLPNLILRSSLFSASKTHGAKDVAIRDFKITTYGGDSKSNIKIFLTAYRQFNQLDLDLLLELIKLQQQKKTMLLKITIRQLTLKTTGQDGKPQYEQIKEQLELLQNASIKLQYGQYTFIGSILSSAYFDDKEHVYIIRLNPDLQPIFSKNNWTGINIDIRKNLTTNLAKWLHGFYSSHVNSKTPIKTETIYELSGATDKDIARWNRETLIKALDDIKHTYHIQGGKFNYNITNGLLLVHKSQVNSQNKNLKKTLIAKSKRTKPRIYNPKA